MTQITISTGDWSCANLSVFSPNLSSPHLTENMRNPIRKLWFTFGREGSRAPGPWYAWINLA